MEFFHEGSSDTVIDETRAGQLLDALLIQLRARGPLRRVLILPPDVTRYHSWAGPLTRLLYERLRDTAELAILPATGTHLAMTDDEIARMFPGVPRALFHEHDWRNGVVPLGEVPVEFIRRVSDGRLDFPVRVEVDRLLTEERWDVILSVGQLVPHEVAGIANHSKNVFVGAGGSDLINKSHWLGAVHGIEQTMGRTDTPVRRVLDYAAEHLARHLPIVYLLTVRARDGQGRLVTRGLYAGDDAACFRRGAELCRRVLHNRGGPVPGGQPRHPRPRTRQGGRLPRPAGVQVDLAGEQGGLPHAHGDGRRWRAGGAGAGRAHVRGGRDD